MILSPDSSLHGIPQLPESTTSHYTDLGSLSGNHREPELNLGTNPIYSTTNHNEQSMINKLNNEKITNVDYGTSNYNERQMSINLGTITIFITMKTQPPQWSIRLQFDFSSFYGWLTEYHLYESPSTITIFIYVIKKFVYIYFEEY